MSYQVIARKYRPQRFADVVGQDHVTTTLGNAISSGRIAHAYLFAGPRGTGKTTIARMIADVCEVQFQSLSAVLSGVKDIRAAIDIAKQQRQMSGTKTLLFVDEVHRFNKSQQDAFLPFVEDGTVIFVGATTENPSFELNNALLSRSRIYKLKSIEADQLVRLMQRALADEINGLGLLNLVVTDETLAKLALAADGDGRKALNLLEISSDLAQDNVIDDKVIGEVLGSDFRRFDKGGDLFFEQISALHKAVRGSSPDAALYWLSRMLDGGCDPLYVARRVVRMASEDIGNADPRALQLCLNAWEVQERLGSPEGELAIAQAVVYLAIAAKSNAVYSAFSLAQQDAATRPSFDVPLHIRNAPTQMMKDMGYGEDYHYAHHFDDAFVPGENYFPEALQDRKYYEPVNRGMEIQIREKLDALRKMDTQSDFQRYRKKE